MLRKQDIESEENVEKRFDALINRMRPKEKSDADKKRLTAAEFKRERKKLKRLDQAHRQNRNEEPS